MVSCSLNLQDNSVIGKSIGEKSLCRRQATRERIFRRWRSRRVPAFPTNFLEASWKRSARVSTALILMAASPLLIPLHRRCSDGVSKNSSEHPSTPRFIIRNRTELHFRKIAVKFFELSAKDGFITEVIKSFGAKTAQVFRSITSSLPCTRMASSSGQL